MTLSLPPRPGSEPGGPHADAKDPLGRAVGDSGDAVERRGHARAAPVVARP